MTDFLLAVAVTIFHMTCFIFDPALCFQGCAQVSLADFNSRNTSLRWYNVLSFKFMQADLPPAVKASAASTATTNSKGVAPAASAASSSLPSLHSSSSSSDGLKPSRFMHAKQVSHASVHCCGWVKDKFKKVRRILLLSRLLCEHLGPMQMGC